MPENHYRTLHVRRDAAPAVIEKAYKALCALHHPDRNPGREDEANEEMKRLNAAYAVLSDPASRAAYDGELLRHVWTTFWHSGLIGLVREWLDS